jgi:hypothetical protein
MKLYGHIMDTQQMMEIMLARMQEMMNEMKNEIKETIRGEMKPMRDKRAEAHLQCEEPTSADMKVCHEAAEADTEEIEPDPRMIQSIAEHQEVPKADAIVKPVRGQKKRHRGRKQAAGRHGEPKELTRGVCGTPEEVG